jgi:methyl-accepting chemotaxis protein
MRFNDLPISRKLAAGFAGVVSIVLVMSLTLLVAFNTIHVATQANDESQARLAAADTALSALVEQQNAVRGYVATGDESFPPRIQGFAADFQSAWGKLDALISDPTQKQAVADLKGEAAKVMDEENAQIAMRRDPAQLQNALASLPTSGRLTRVRELLKSITDPEHALVAKRSAAQDQAFRQGMASLGIGCAIAVLLSVVMGWLLSRAIAAPISGMTRSMDRLAAGDNAVDVPSIGRKDEVGRMAAAVQTFKEAAVEKLRLEADAEARRREIEVEREKAELERARVAREQAEVVGQLAAGLEHLSSGILTSRLDQPFAPAYEKLRSDFNAAMVQLQGAIRVVATNAQAIRASSEEISHASDDLSRRTEQQAASLEETAAALDQITTTVRRTAEGATRARDAIEAARTDAEHSGVVVREAVSAMSEIETSAQQISQIIGVIDEIAFQTNLLALNAGVEAARAGDAGRGFAVVAQEVRALAQRSAEAAKEIKTLIMASSNQVDRGVKLVGETGKVLQRIATQVTEISGVVSDIASSAQEQATGLAQVNVAVNQMDQVTQQNAAMVEESTAASHALSGEADAMALQVARFELGDAGQASAPPAARVDRAAAPRAVAALKTQSQRQPAFAEPGWSEF